MSVNTRVTNKRGAVSDVYSVLYSINKAEEEDGAYGDTGEMFLWHDSSKSSRTREQHLLMTTAAGTDPTNSRDAHGGVENY